MHNVRSASSLPRALGLAMTLQRINAITTKIVALGILAAAVVHTQAQTWETVAVLPGNGNGGQTHGLFIDPFSVDPSQPGFFLGGSWATEEGGKIVHYETSTGETTLCDPSRGTIERFAFDPTTSNLYAVGKHPGTPQPKWVVTKSSDGGVTWSVIDDGGWFDYASVAQGVTVDPNGNVFVSGYTLSKKGVYVWRVRKGTEVAGKFVWSNTLTIADKYAQGGEIIYVAPAPGKHSGGIYAVGCRTPNSTTQWIVMRSADSGASWQKVDGWNPPRTAAVANAIASDPEGNLYVVGYTSGSTTAWQIRRSTNGGASWNFLEDTGDSTGSFNQARAVATDAAGNVYVAGYTGADGRVNWTVRCWSAVTQQWDNWPDHVRFPMYPLGSRAQGVAVTALGEVYVAGGASGYGWLLQKLIP